MMFTRPGCLYCQKAKALLKQRGVEFGTVDFGVQPERRAMAPQLSGSQLVPQVFVGRRHIGGFDVLKALDDDGILEQAMRWQPVDGQAFTPTRAEDIAAATAMPLHFRGPLLRRAEEMAKLSYNAGSSPKLGEFLKYAATGKFQQDHSRNVPLNLAAAPGDVEPQPALPNASAAELAAMLRQMVLYLVDTFASPSTGTVDYAGMKDCKEMGLFRALASELGHPRLRDELLGMSEDDKKAFLINLYNAMIFHGIVTFGRRSGLWNIYCFFVAPAVSYRLGGVPVSLDEVENGMLRRQPGYFPDATPSSGSWFGAACCADEDAQARAQSNVEFRRGMRMAQLDARVHMALNCGASGCPPTAVYRGPTIDPELDEAAVAFVDDDRNVLVEESAGGLKVTMTELFQMYIGDFAGEGADANSEDGQRNMIKWVLPWARGQKRDLLSKALEDGARLTFVWDPYNWETNGPEIPLDSRIYSPTL